MKKHQKLLKTDGTKELNIIVETKGVDIPANLRDVEEKKINCAKLFCIKFENLVKQANETWKDCNHVVAFLPDHGCHEIDHHLGDHGLDMEEDMHIIHFYGLYK